MDVAHARRHTAEIIDAVGEELYGLETVIKLSLAALLSGGHVLLEGNPGLGKTGRRSVIGRRSIGRCGRTRRRTARVRHARCRSPARRESDGVG